MNLKRLSPGPYWKVENGKLVVTTEFIVKNEYGKELTVEAGFVSDGYSGIYDPPDENPAIVHDFIYEGHRELDNGTAIDFNDANRFLWYLMWTSKSRITRCLASLYFVGVSWFGLRFWNEHTKFTVKGIFRRKSRFGGFPLKMA